MFIDFRERKGEREKRETLIDMCSDTVFNARPFGVQNDAPTNGAALLGSSAGLPSDHDKNDIDTLHKSNCSAIG